MKKLTENEIKKIVEEVNSNKRDTTHIPYEKATGLLPDFEVEYEIDRDPEIEGGKLTQGMRCDFLYEGDKSPHDPIYMIWPEILDKNNNVILDTSIEIEKKGLANMWIMLPESRARIHCNRLKPGTKGYWVVGSCKVANVKVTKILGLFSNIEKIKELDSKK